MAKQAFFFRNLRRPLADPLRFSSAALSAIGTRIWRRRHKRDEGEVDMGTENERLGKRMKRNGTGVRDIPLLRLNLTC